MTASKYFTSIAAFNLLVLTLPLNVLLFRSKFKAIWRMAAKSSGAEPFLIMVTGSARLDILRKSGDPLQGRYHHLRLHPLSIKKLGITKEKDLIQLLQLGGFPEPYFSKSEIEAKRWSTNYRSLLVNQESVAIETISDLSKLELLSLRLPELVGSP
ncbi:MAG: hypothetical protein KAJ62_00915, partial [Desulfobacteraceae bacterium]|nr:hypothetical protein [Desulfobacteraceae bacterium]